MSKFYNIKWRAEDIREAKRVLRNFNDKLKRELTRNPRKKSALPQFYNTDTGEFESKMTLKNFKNIVNTRADFNRELNSLKRFSKRGAEDVVLIPGNYNEAYATKWQLEEMTRRSGIINQKRQVRLENKQTLELVDNISNTGITYGEAMKMGMKSDQELKPTKPYTEGMRQEDVKWKYRSLIIETKQKYYKERDIQLKENFIKGLERTFTKGEIDDVVAKIRSMDTDEFVLKFDQKEGSAFEDIYFPNDESKQAYINALRHYWLGINVTE